MLPEFIATSKILPSKLFEIYIKDCLVETLFEDLSIECIDLV